MSGGAKGADALGERYAEIHNIPTKIYYADWKKFGRRAGPIRNVDIINRCDVCVAFWDGQSHGTKHDIDLCREQHKLCIIFNYITKSTKKKNNKNLKSYKNNTIYIKKKKKQNKSFKMYQI